MQTNGHTNRRLALVLYGSETGNAQEFAEEIGRLTERLHFSTRVDALNSITLAELTRNDVVFFVISTTGQGELPLNARKFWRTLLKKSLPQGCLKRVHCTSFGLGDSSYPQFNFAARKLRARVRQLGGSEIYPAGEADEQHEDSTEGNFLSWFLPLRNALLTNYPLPSGLGPIPDHVPLPSKWGLCIAEKPFDGERGMYDASHNPSEYVNGHARGGYPEDSPSPQGSFINDKRSIPCANSMNLEANERVTPDDHWQDVRLLTITTKEIIDYAPGDVLSITPRNFKEDVDCLISQQCWGDYADENIAICSLTQLDETNMHSYPIPPIPQLPSSPNLTLRTVLVDYLDITAIPRRSFFARLVEFCTDDDQKQRLEEFTNPELIDELWDYTTRPRRSTIEVLQEFNHISIPWQRVLDVFPLLKPRQFSIASGGTLKQSARGGTTFELLVAIVKYHTVIRKIRKGVCTRYLAALRPGSEMQIVFQKGSLNWKAETVERPSLLIGAGTGIAPLRSILWEKKAQLETDSSKLVFGCRNEHADYFFREEFTNTSKLQPLVGTVRTAFSRDQQQKRYIQDTIRDDAENIFTLIYDHKAVVYVCGSSGKMPRAVREALLHCLVRGYADHLKKEPVSEEAKKWAEDYLMQMEKNKQYIQETW